jgi:hypothetical protein
MTNNPITSSDPRRLRNINTAIYLWMAALAAWFTWNCWVSMTAIVLPLDELPQTSGQLINAYVGFKARRYSADSWLIVRAPDGKLISFFGPPLSDKEAALVKLAQSSNASVTVWSEPEKPLVPFVSPKHDYLQVKAGAEWLVWYDPHRDTGRKHAHDVIVPIAFGISLLISAVTLLAAARTWYGGSSSS